MSSDERAVSEVLGYALVFSLVITTVAIVTVSGLGQLQDTRDTEQLNNAERAFDLLATNIDDLARRGAPSRSTEIRLAEAQLDISDPITISVEVNGSDPADNFTVTSDISPIIYRSSNSEQIIVYSGGTIFRSSEDGNEGIAVRKPAIVAENERLIIPIIMTQSSVKQSISGGTARVRVSKIGTTLALSNSTGEYETVSVNVTSPRSQLWLDMLLEYPGFDDCGEVTGSTNEIYCRMEEPERLQISFIRIDAQLSG